MVRGPVDAFWRGAKELLGLPRGRRAARVRALMSVGHLSDALYDTMSRVG